MQQPRSNGLGNITLVLGGALSHLFLSEEGSNVVVHSKQLVVVRDTCRELFDLTGHLVLERPNLLMQRCQLSMDRMQSHG